MELGCGVQQVGLKIVGLDRVSRENLLDESLDRVDVWFDVLTRFGVVLRFPRVNERIREKVS